MKGSRLLHLALVLAGISLGTFALLELAPGDPAEIILRSRHEAPAPDRIAALRASLGLDDPWPLRYGRWLGRLGQGDLGRSWASGRPVGQEIAARAGATLELALGAFVLVLILSSASGAWAAWKRGRAPDQALRAASVLFAALPNYWLGLLLIYFLAMKAHWFPVMGRGGLEHLCLPALSLALAVAVLQGRVLRATLLQVMSADHIRFARAKGLGPWHIFSRHLLRNALPPLVTVWGVSLGQLFGRGGDRGIGVRLARSGPAPGAVGAQPRFARWCRPWCCFWP